MATGHLLHSRTVQIMFAAPLIARILYNSCPWPHRLFIILYFVGQKIGVVSNDSFLGSHKAMRLVRLQSTAHRENEDFCVNVKVEFNVQF